ncbi:hypothetical protein LOZ80_00670 [Paenibacillus sp. HWE-109]|uniref:hypothetical protein n=1 Tax=Paenibacillus sp. HWE-109 TaxID=1306526 RepID=UPI001EDF2CC8|nr:hypothetical protein [Paenibacillus sp. HWE-109]UKS27500.1 hypothetical protein LOZ80_00670 [Paenibacillus sp. HWE-109]
MKRYWLLIVLIVFSVCSMSYYYVAEAQSPKPEYYLKTIAGQEENAAKVVVQGSYEVEAISVTTQGSYYPSDHQTYWKQLDSSDYFLDDLAGLREQHRSFMRGKRDVNAFFEDEKVIGYAGSESPFGLEKEQSDILNIALYDKGQKKQSADFKVQIKKNKDEFISVSDVQVKERTMKVVVAYQPKFHSETEFASTEYHLYTIDLDKRSIVAHERIETGAKQDAKLRTIVYNVWGTQPLSAKGYIIFDQTTYALKDVKDHRPDTSNDELLNHEIFAYDIWKGQLTKIQNESIQKLLMKSGDDLIIRQTGDNVYFNLFSESGPSEVLSYSISDNKVNSDVVLELQSLQSEWGRTGIFQIVNNRLYMLMFGKQNPAIAIVDLATKKTIYQGVIERKDMVKVDKLAFSDITVKE